MIIVAFERESHVQRMLYLISNEIAQLEGQLVIASRRVKNGRDACSGRQMERAVKAMTALPEQIREAEATKKALTASLATNRDPGGGR